MRMKRWWTVCLEKSGEWFRGKGGLELPGKMLSHGHSQAKPCRAALQGLELPDGRKGFVPGQCISHPTLCLLQDWPEDPYAAANLLETMGSVFLGF